MTVVLRKGRMGPVPTGTGVPLTWWPITLDGKPAVRAVCGKGHEAIVELGLEGHEVAPDGTVTPSLVCPVDGCGWHEMVRLDGWTP